MVIEKTDEGCPTISWYYELMLMKIPRYRLFIRKKIILPCQDLSKFSERDQPILVRVKIREGLLDRGDLKLKIYLLGSLVAASQTKDAAFEFLPRQTDVWFV